MTPKEIIQTADLLQRIPAESWAALQTWIDTTRTETNDNGTALLNEKGGVMSAAERDWHAGGVWHLKDLAGDLAALRSGEYQLTWPEVRAWLDEQRKDDDEQD